MASIQQPSQASAAVDLELEAKCRIGSPTPAMEAREGRGLPVELLIQIIELVAAQGQQDETEDGNEEEGEEEKEKQGEVWDSQSDKLSLLELERIATERVAAGHGEEAVDDGGGDESEWEDCSEEGRSELEKMMITGGKPVASRLSWVPSRPLRQLDLASLRLASKLLCRLATPHFYNVIQISDASHTMNLVAQLQGHEELCKGVRGIWWGVKDENAGTNVRVVAFKSWPSSVSPPSMHLQVKRA